MLAFRPSTSGRPAGLEHQVAEHVVERPVLEHQYDDVVDLAEVRERRIGGRSRRAPSSSHGQ
jgi:hypothetical protein